MIRSLSFFLGLSLSPSPLHYSHLNVDQLEQLCTLIALNELQVHERRKKREKKREKSTVHSTCMKSELDDRRQKLSES